MCNVVRSNSQKSVLISSIIEHVDLHFLEKNWYGCYFTGMLWSPTWTLLYECDLVSKSGNPELWELETGTKCVIYWWFVFIKEVMCGACGLCNVQEVDRKGKNHCKSRPVLPSSGQDEMPRSLTQKPGFFNLICKYQNICSWVHT